ncbi:MAG: ubiquinol-cytochrome c reductase iron-sulfur subunit [bacterium]
MPESNNSKSHPTKNEKDEITRRRFLNMVGNSAIGVAGLGSIGVTLEFLKPNVLLEIPLRFKAGTVDNTPPGTVVFNPEYRVFIFRDVSGFFYAVSAVCTHLGCTVNWKAEGTPEHAEGVIACPCHGSVFSRTGVVLSGPAPRDLDRFRMRLEDGKLVVDTAETVTEEEMILKV